MKKFIALVLTVLLCAGVAGCEGTAAGENYSAKLCYVNQLGSELYTSALNADKMMSNGAHCLPVFKMESEEELERFVQDFGDDFVQDQSRNEVPSFDEATEDMDKGYFSKYTLFLVAVPANSGSYRYGVDSIENDGKTLCIHVVQTNNPELVTMDLAGWFVLVSVPKQTVAGCTEFDAQLDNIG